MTEQNVSADSGAQGLASVVRDKTARLARARKSGELGWPALAHVGVLAWIFVLPVIAGAIIGRAVAGWFGARWWGLVLLALGLGVGIYGAWRELRRSLNESDP